MAKSKLKKLTVELIPETDAEGVPTPAYVILRPLVEKHHRRLADAKIALAWNLAWKADKDGAVKLGKAKKATELDRLMHGYDLIVLLNRGYWGNFSEAQRAALIDHELCHFEVVRDKAGDPKTDERGRTCYRIRKHDVEEFQEIVARHGLWKSDLEQFVEAARDAAPLFETVNACE